MPGRALHWLFVAVAVSLFGAVAGVGLLRTLNEPIPAVLTALHAHEDALASPPPAPVRRVVVALIDGLGAAPFDARLQEGALGAIGWRASLDSGLPSRSRPVYHAIFTGLPAWAAGIRSNAYATQRADSVPDRVRAGGGKVAWMLENEPWFCELFCAREDVVVEGAGATSPEVFARVWGEAPDLLVLHLTEVDDAGHLTGASSAAYVEASRRAIGVVATFRAIARRATGGDHALWFVGADHGHMPGGGHGGPEDAVRRVTWVVLDDADADAGAPSEAGGAPTATLASLAPTIARALGVSPPRASIVSGLPLFPALLGAPYQPSAERVRAAEAARAASDERALGSPRSRVTAASLVLLAGLGALVGLRRKQGLAEAFVFLAALGGVAVIGPELSMSAARTEWWYLFHTLGALIATATAAWVIARKWASPLALAIASALFPVVALVVVRGSLGRADAAPFETVLWPCLGLVPASVCAAVALVEVARAARARVPARAQAGRAVVKPAE